MSLMSDQLLKAGLITEDDLKKSAEKPRKQKKSKPFSANKTQTNTKKHNQPSTNPEPSDLAAFYKQRSVLENKEKQQALAKKKEQDKRKKEINLQIDRLVAENILNQEAADIRYNFVVGKTIKYVFVTEQQQEQLANGELAITFHKGKRCIIPTEIARKILTLHPEKVVILI